MPPSPSAIQTAILRGKCRPGMTFEQKVWAITARIPKGKVATYGWVARQLGGTAYRAVGRALNRNPYSPTVPCHRVVGSNGSLTGYAHGLAAKKKLLMREGIEFTKGKINLQRFGMNDDKKNLASGS